MDSQDIQPAGCVEAFLCRRLYSFAGWLILWLTVPAFFKGPFSQVNPAIAPIWLNWVIEVQPLMSESTTTKVAVIGSILLALGFILWQFAVKTRNYRTEHLLTCMLGLLLFIP